MKLEPNSEYTMIEPFPGMVFKTAGYPDGTVYLITHMGPCPMSPDGKTLYTPMGPYPESIIQKVEVSLVQNKSN